MTDYRFKLGDRVQLRNLADEHDRGGPWHNGRAGIVVSQKDDTGYNGRTLTSGPSYGVRFDDYEYSSPSDNHSPAESVLEHERAALDEEVAKAIRSIETVYNTPTGEHPAIIKLRERDEAAIAQGYTKGDVNHFVQPIIGHMRLALSKGEVLTTEYMEYAVEQLHKATNAELAWLHEQGEL